MTFGRFIHSLDKLADFKISGVDEPPDIIAVYKNQLMGIEITGIYDKEVVAEINTAKELLNKCEKQLVTKVAFEGNVVLNVIPSKLKFSKANEQNVIDEICDYVISILSGKETMPPEYINFKYIETSASLGLILYEDYWLKKLTPESVHKTIQTKEKDIPKYKELKAIQQCWLLITVDGASQRSSFDYSLIKGFDIDTEFDNVFVYDVFSKKTIYSKFNL